MENRDRVATDANEIKIQLSKIQILKFPNIKSMHL